MLNFTTKNKAIKEQMFKNREPRKTKNVVEWEKEEQLKKSMVEIIQQIQKTQTQPERPSISMEGWNTTWLGMPNTSHVEAHKCHDQTFRMGMIATSKLPSDWDQQGKNMSYKLFTL